MTEAELGVARAEVEANDGALQLAHSRAATQRALFKEGLIPKATMETVELDLANAERTAQLATIALSAARSNLARAQAGAAKSTALLARSVVRAPIDGVILELGVVTGGAVRAPIDGGDAASAPATIGGLKGIVFRADATAAQALQVALGQPATITVTGTERRLPGTVTFIPQYGEARDALPASYAVEIAVPNADVTSVPLNSSGSAEVSADVAVAIAVPLRCIQFDRAGGAYVTLAGSRDVRSVMLGRADDTAIEVVEGLRAGDVVSSCGPS